MEPVTILPPVNPERVPRAVHKTLNVPVIALPKVPKQTPVPVPVHKAGAAPKTHIPIGYTRPILCDTHRYVDRAHMG